MRRLLIIGGTGVLSSAITDEALRQGISVTMINRGNRRIPEGVTHIKADRDDICRIESQLNGQTFDAVMDFLCYTDAATEKSFRLYSKYTKQYFFVSSMAVYDKTKPGPLVENHPKPLQVWSYSVNKWISELKLQQMAAKTDCKVTVIRPSVTYGNTRIPYGIYPQYGYHWTFCARILAGKPIITWNQGKNTTTMLRVEDFAIGMVGLVGNPQAYNEAFNICADTSTTFREVLDIVSKYLHKEVKTIDLPVEWYAKEMPKRAGELKGGRAMEVDCSPEEEIRTNEKIKRVVPAFRQSISVEEGVIMTLKAYEKQNFQNGIDWRFDADTDRIIRKWCRKKGIDYKSFNLGFTDYLGNSNFKDKFIFWRQYNKDNFFVAFVNRGIWFMSIVIRKFKTIF